MRKQVWLNLQTGEFSNSWGEDEHGGIVVQELIQSADKECGWKLIEFECLNDPGFEFTINMRLR